MFFTQVGYIKCWTSDDETPLKVVWSGHATRVKHTYLWNNWS